MALPLSEAVTAGQTGHVLAHNDIHDVVNEAARYNVANTFAAAQIISANGGKTTLALTDTTADVGITIGGDTNLYRSAANTLKTDDALSTAGVMTVGSDGWTGWFQAYGNTAGSRITYGHSAEGGVNNLGIRSGQIVFGPPYDTNLYRSGANELKTDDVFWAAGQIYSSGILTAQHQTSNKVDVGHNGTTSAPAICFNSDTNLYRSAANELATDDIVRFNAAGTFQTTVGAAGGGSALPATPTKYLKIKDEAGTTFVVPCYAAA